MSQKEENKRHGARSNQKLKILYLAKIFLDNTDANHDITLQEIIDKLSANNVTAERKKRRYKCRCKTLARSAMWQTAPIL